MAVAVAGRRGARAGAGLSGLQAAGILLPLVAIVLVGAVAHGGLAVHMAFTLCAFGIGLLFYFYAPDVYVVYAWWLWFLTPLARRLVDMHEWFTLRDPMILAPILVTGITTLSAIRNAPQLQRRSLAPFGLVIAALGYGLVAGAVKAGAGAAVYTFFNWLAPIGFAFHIATHPENFELWRDRTASVMFWTVCLLGAYGVMQFIAPPVWDTTWMKASQMASIGNPAPFEVRVFGTITSPGPYAMVIGAGLLLLPAIPHKLKLPVFAVGVAAILLSLVRSAWIAAIGGGAVYVMLLSGAAKRRFLLGLTAACGLLVAGVAITPVIRSGPVADLIDARMSTFENISDDASYVRRVDNLRYAIEHIAETPMGEGLGSTGTGVALLSAKLDQGIRSFDNGVLEIFYSLGWIGGIFFALGVALLSMRTLTSRLAPHDHFGAAAKAVIVFALIAAPAGNVFSGVVGMIFWGFIGLRLAGERAAGRTMQSQLRARAPLPQSGARSLAGVA